LICCNWVSISIVLESRWSTIGTVSF